jgi:hypothetical protein
VRAGVAFARARIAPPSCAEGDPALPCLGKGVTGTLLSLEVPLARGFMMYWQCSTGDREVIAASILSHAASSQLRRARDAWKLERAWQEASRATIETMSV